MTFSVYQYTRMCSILLTTSNATLYTVPALTQALVKDINVSNPTGVAANFQLQMPGGQPIFQNTTIPGGTTIHWTGLITLNAGETISGLASVATTVYVIISGQTGV
jgi:hypothetical protein